MTAVVLDASATGAILLPDEEGAMREHVLCATREHDIHVPAIWAAEIASLTINAFRRKRLGPEDLMRVCAQADLFRRTAIIAPDPPTHVVVGLAREFGLSAYDASYAVLALELSATLLTGDGKLRMAAPRIGIELFA